MKVRADLGGSNCGKGPLEGWEGRDGVSAHAGTGF